MSVVVLNDGHVPLAGKLYEIVYTPAALAPGSIAPLTASSDNPTGILEKMPPVVPVTVTPSVPVDEQKAAAP